MREKERKRDSERERKREKERECMYVGTRRPILQWLQTNGGE